MTFDHDGTVYATENAENDVRFRENPHVTGFPHIRFYAGAPVLIEPGLVLGTLCIIDTKPRALSDEDKANLIDLAGVVSNLLHQYRYSHQVAELSLRLQRQAVELKETARHLTRSPRLLRARLLTPAAVAHPLA